MLDVHQKIGVILWTQLVIKFLGVVVAVLLLKFGGYLLLDLIIDHFHEKILSERAAIEVDSKVRRVEVRIKRRTETSEFKRNAII